MLEIKQLLAHTPAVDVKFERSRYGPVFLINQSGCPFNMGFLFGCPRLSTLPQPSQFAANGVAMIKFCFLTLFFPFYACFNEALIVTRIRIQGLVIEFDNF